MSYGDNPTNVAKGSFGENLVSYTLTQKGWEVVPQPMKTDKNPASIVDIKATREDKTIFVEVKVKTAFYWSDYFPVYTLETWKTNRSLQLQEQNGIETWLTVVDASRGGIFWAKISELIRPCVCQAYQFPVRHFQQKNQIINDYFHIDQFTLLEKLTPDPQRYLGKYFDRDEFEPQEELGTDDMNDFPELENKICNDNENDTTTDSDEFPFVKRINEIPHQVGFLPKYSDFAIPVFKAADAALMVGLSDIGRFIGYESGINLSSWGKIAEDTNIVIVRAKRFDVGWEPRNTRLYFFVQDVKTFLTAYCSQTCRAGKKSLKYERYVAAKQLLDAWDTLIAKFNGTPIDNNAAATIEAADPLPQKYQQPSEQPAPKLTTTTRSSVIEEFARATQIPVDEVKHFVIAAKCKFDPTLAELFR